MGKYYLNEKIGDPVLMASPGIHATDTVDSDGVGGVPIRDAEGILFLLTTGTLTGGSATITISYASDGLSSNASVDTDVWTSSNMVFAAIDSDTENLSYVMDVNLGHTGIDPASSGKFFHSAVVLGAATNYGLVGIPYNLKHSPTTNATTVLIR
jgi:hypothetical protein